MTALDIIAAAGVLVVFYTYVGYPLALRAVARLRGAASRHPDEDAEWPTISITVPVYNEEAQIRGLLDSLLALDYPADRRQILIVSDASTDATDEIVREYAHHGVELVRQEQRRGKTAAESAVRGRLRGEIVINTDASIRILPQALKPLIRQFRDPSVGVASGRDVSISQMEAETTAGEAGYIGYEMWIRERETEVYGIVGASGCFYAIRPHLHSQPLQDGLSRDFASALAARTHGYRAVSVPEALCYVPRSGSLRREYARKVRTMTRGMQTLIHYRHLFNPFRYGAFAWMLFSHKVCRWLSPWAALAAAAAFAASRTGHPLVMGSAAVVAVLALCTVLAWLWPEERRLPKALSIPAYLVLGNVAVLHSSVRVLLRRGNPVWEPTRREAVDTRAPLGSGRT